jgi:hypothetical protein
VGVCGVAGANVSERTWELYSLDLLFAKRILVAFDSDDAGDAGAATAMRVLGAERSRRARPTLGKDIGDHVLAGGTISELAGEDLHVQVA